MQILFLLYLTVFWPLESVILREGGYLQVVGIYNYYDAQVSLNLTQCIRKYKNQKKLPL